MFWSVIFILGAFVASVVVLIVVGVVRRDPAVGIAVLYAGVLLAGVLFIGAPFLFLADVVLSLIRYRSWPWKPPIPERPDAQGL
jgi:hypothetical protein